MMIASTAIASPTASGAAASSVNFESTFAAASALQANPSSIFSNKSVATFDLRGAPAAPNSAAMVANLNSQIVNNWNGVAAFNAHQYNTAFAVASPNTPLIRVKWWDCFGYGWTPDGLYNGRTQFVDVPIPAAAIPATGTDRELSVWSPSQDKLWEFWQMSKDASGQWSACWGGRIDNVSTSIGQYLGDFGVAASGLAMASYTVTMSEARSCVPRARLRVSQ